MADPRVPGRQSAIVVAPCRVLVTGHEVRDLLDLSDDVIWLAAGTTSPTPRRHVTMEYTPALAVLSK